MSHSLRERPIDFTSSDVVASCDVCGARLPMMSWERFDNHDHVVDCPGCHGRLSHQERTLALTSTADPMLEIDAVPTVAWYHASIYEQWPPTVAAKRERALHLGTYEAAIDTMHFRMERMGEADAPFFLHRVTLDPDHSVIDREVHVDAGETMTGRVPMDLVTRGGHTVRRYVNAVEHRGSISLAVDLDAISSVQSIAIPVDALADTATADASAAEVRCIAEHDAARDDHAAAVADLAAHPPPPNPDPLRQSIDEMLGNSGVTRLDIARDIRIHKANLCRDEVLAAAYLSAGVSAERSAALAQALHKRSSRDPATIHRLYRQHAALLTHPDQVVAALAVATFYRSPALSR